MELPFETRNKNRIRTITIFIKEKPWLSHQEQEEHPGHGRYVY